MTAIQEKAFEMIKQLPEDKVYYIVKMLEGVEGLFPGMVANVESAEQKAYENLQCFRKCGDADIDYKAELQQVLEGKYEGAD